MKKYLITGVNGFVGRYFVECLRKYEPESNVLGVDIGDIANVADIEYKKIDLRDGEAVSKMIAEYKPDYIVHLAAMSSVAQSWQEPATCFLNNTSAFLNIAEAVRLQALNSRILSVGSSEEYGIYNEPMQEIFNLHPKSPYSVARLSQEYLSKLYVDRFGTDIVMTRSFNHIGPRQSDRFVIPSFIKQLVAISRGAENKMLVGNIEVIRDFLDVRDVVEAYYLILQKGKMREVYNVCSGQGRKLREIITTTADLLGIEPNVIIDEARVRPNDMLRVVGDNTKLKTQLGWKQKYTLEETLQDIIDYWKQN